ncbi:hypothetical protein C5167_008947 [Papaver somniferum]|uniref:EF-hand domain-containing protein n=1 Tax=Papaver somniferum TaxID=3469 RepID=A0A4Y7JX37_PAPSO|nr:sodium/calcium exchanger NCL1-like [Papaver somniferum]RZC65257.1 hypothetical protein C5167_008947 [Papaver somniferum]
MANKYSTLSYIFAIVFLSPYGEVGYSRAIGTITNSEYNIDELRVIQQPIFHSLKETKLAAPVTCEPKYGFLPCTSALWGSLFLVVVYEYVSYLGERYISMGSELMFKVLGPGIFGASAFQILGSLPEAILVMATGLYGTKEVAQDQVKFGIWLLSGSTIMLLTILWGACIACGCYDLSSPPPLTPTSSTDHLLLSAPALASSTKPLSLTGYGVTIDIETNYTAAIMMFSLIPFMVALPQLWGAPLGHYPVLIALIFSVSFLVAFIFYQVFSPWIQNRRLEYVMSKVLGKVALGKLLSEDGVPKTPIIKELFHKIDRDDDGFITPKEIRGLIIGVQFEEVGFKKDDFLDNVMEEFDNYADVHIDEDEFIKGISSWLLKTKQSAYKRDRKRRCQRSPNSTNSQVHDATTEEEQHLLVNEPSLTTHIVTHKDIHVFENVVWTFIKAVSLLVLGIGVLVLSADPLIESIQNFSNAANIDPFLFSFVVLPIAVNYREAMSAIKSARHKKQHSASLTLSEIYTAVFMNNIVGISITLVMVYAQGLAWDFAAEVFVVMTISISMGFIGLRCKTLRLWTSIVAIFLYFFSLFLLYALINVFGWV